MDEIFLTPLARIRLAAALMRASGPDYLACAHCFQGSEGILVTDTLALLQAEAHGLKLTDLVVLEDGQSMEAEEQAMERICRELDREYTAVASLPPI